MDMRITSTPNPLTSTQLARRVTAPQPGIQEVGFSSAFKNALQSVSAAQNRAGDLQRASEAMRGSADQAVAAVAQGIARVDDELQERLRTQADAIAATEAKIAFKAADVALSVKQATDSCLLYTSPTPRDPTRSRMPSSA